ncbi:MAG: GldG family protein [Pseudomonadota bacterium]
MKLHRPHLFQFGLLVCNFAYGALMALAAAALYQLAAHHPLQWDVTQSARNTLEPESVKVLKQLPGEIRLTVYATAQDAKLGNIRKPITDFVALYQRAKPDIRLTFIDPLNQPEEMRKANIQANGEMVIAYGGRTEHLTNLTEQALTSALLRLAHRKDQLLMYLDGHGERRLDGIANHDLGEFGKRLQQNGFQLSPLNLALAQDVPRNATLLVITQPQLDLLPGEADKLLRFVADGGNLLWLLDPEPLHGLEPLAEKLGLLLTPGIVLDPAAAEMRAPSTWALGSGYPPHPVTHDFNLITAFPFARAIGWEENKEWQHTTLVEAAPRGWVSSRPLQGAAHFDASRDVPGPVSIALALQRNVSDREQRIVVVGSGAFLANAFSGNGGNLDLGVNMVNWLSNEEKLITLQPRAAQDGSLNLNRSQLTYISTGFVILLPALLALVGAVLWWRRRR